MLNKLSKINIKIILVLLYIVIIAGSIFHVITLYKIKLRLYSKKYEILYLLSLYFNVFDSILFCLCLIIITRNNTINIKYNKLSITLTYFIFFLNLIGLNIVLISLINIFVNKANPKNIDNIDFQQNDSELYLLIRISSLIILLYIIQFPLWFLILIRLLILLNSKTQKQYQYINILQIE